MTRYFRPGGKSRRDSLADSWWKNNKIKMTLSFRLKSGEKPPVDLPETESGAQSVLAFSMAKAGSTLLFDLLHDLAPAAGLAYFSPENAVWGRKDRKAGKVYDMSPVFRDKGYCYGGFRFYPAYDVPIIETAPSILLVRDPKDMLVSNYFSNAFSHRPPTDDEESPAYQQFMKRRERIRNTDINDYVRQIVGNTQRMFASYRALLHKPTLKIFRYEDVIEQKRPWVNEILDHFGWTVPGETVDEIIARYDLFPDAEKPDAHVRQVKPGNFREHLNKQTVTAINAALAEDLAVLGYTR